MNPAVQEIISKIESEDTKSKSDAITDLALMLEMHSWKLNYDQRISRYSTFLSKDLIEIILNKQDQEEIIVFLKFLILNRDKLSSSLIWAIGKSTPDVGLIPLLDVVAHQSLTFNDEELYQLLMALGSLLFFDTSDSIDEETKQLVARSSLASFLEKISLMSSENQYASNRLREAAQGLLESII